MESAGSNRPGPSEAPAQQPRKRKNHRGGKKKRAARRKSFAVAQDDMPQSVAQDPALEAARDDFYHMHRRNLSNTSVETEALLDHREQPPFLRSRRPSVPLTSTAYQHGQGPSRLRTVHARDSEDDEEREAWDENVPLLANPSGRLRAAESGMGLSGYGSHERPGSAPRSGRDSSRASSRRKLLNPFTSSSDNYNVNYPPSVPASPQLLPMDRLEMSFGDVMLRDELSGQASPRRVEGAHGPPPMRETSPLGRRSTIPGADVCFPQEGMSEMADDELHMRMHAETAYRMRSRRRRRKWPDLGFLDEWSRFEKEGRSDQRRAKTITEPQLINGRLRSVNKGWFRAEEDAPYRFTYFNEELQSTIHSQTISELVQPGGSFRELFIPERPVLSDSEEESDDEGEPEAGLHRGSISLAHNGDSVLPSREPSIAADPAANTDSRRGGTLSPMRDKHPDASRAATPVVDARSPPATGARSSPEVKPEKPPKYGERPVWWLDVLSPTEAEMRVLSKAFGIHPLTAEDIMMQEAREKVELFRHYYFVNYRSFDQDPNSDTYMDPVDMYVVVFREGVLSFHFSMTPHPANVRRRIRQLNDYMVMSSDWISYAIIDDVTDAYVPLIQKVENEVDDIDDAILRLHTLSDPAAKAAGYPATKTEPRPEAEPPSGGDMLRRVGDCRKTVMGLLRLLANKADVIKGFAKRCNEHWEVAPRSEIGLYLGDIQDHIVTMTANLGHYEKILARAHGNYLAQINIRMNERQEQTADVLGKLTVLGTIVLPMNIITGLWGMNVWVPGQQFEGDLNWFIAITAGLLCFGLACYWIAKRVYGIV